jgi:FkbM family methyltransferase
LIVRNIVRRIKDKEMDRKPLELIDVDCSFFVIDSQGKKIRRDLREENLGGFTYDGYINGEYDDINYMFFENFHFYDAYECTGSDYERLGCKINPGDVVVDIGANVGMFTRWAKYRGASRIISFEPMSLTYSCLVDNSYQIAECHKVAVGSDRVQKMRITGSISNLGGALAVDESLFDPKETVREELCHYMSIRSLISEGIIPEEVDFLKIDCEGGELDIIENTSDEDLYRFKKISMEYHQESIGNSYREKFMQRMDSMGYNLFTLIHGGGSMEDANLLILHAWRD